MGIIWVATGGIPGNLLRGPGTIWLIGIMLVATGGTYGRRPAATPTLQKAPGLSNASADPKQKCRRTKKNYTSATLTKNETENSETNATGKSDPDLKLGNVCLLGLLCAPRKK